MAKYDVFISYSRKDYDEVVELKTYLEHQVPGLAIWFDVDGIESGQQFKSVIIEAINNSNCVLYALSDSSQRSDWVQKELSYAHKKGKRIIPLLLKGASPNDDFLFDYGDVDYVDSSNPIQMDKLVRNLKHLCDSTHTDEVKASLDTNEGNIIPEGSREDSPAVNFSEIDADICNLILSLCANEYDKPFAMSINSVRRLDVNAVEVTGDVLSGSVRVNDGIKLSSALESFPINVIKIKGKRVKSCKTGKSVSLYFGDQSIEYADLSGETIVTKGTNQNLRIDWGTLPKLLKEKYGMVVTRKDLTEYSNNFGGLVQFIRSKIPSSYFNFRQPDNDGVAEKYDIPKSLSFDFEGKKLLMILSEDEKYYIGNVNAKENDLDWIDKKWMKMIGVSALWASGLRVVLPALAFKQIRSEIRSLAAKFFDENEMGRWSKLAIKVDESFCKKLSEQSGYRFRQPTKDELKGVREQDVQSCMVLRISDNPGLLTKFSNSSSK